MDLSPAEQTVQSALSELESARTDFQVAQLESRRITEAARSDLREKQITFQQKQQAYNKALVALAVERGVS